MSVPTAAKRPDVTPAVENGHVPSRVMLMPVAAPSILGLFGFAGATFIVAANLAGWYGSPTSPIVLFPFAAMVGGLAQLLAGMWAYRARDGVATAAHGIWGTFWLAYGLLWLLVATGQITTPTPWYDSPGLAYWFFALAIITGGITLGALFESIATSLVLLLLTVGSAFLTVGFGFGTHAWIVAGGWVLVASAAVAWEVATGLMLRGASGRTIFPMGEWSGSANKPGARPAAAVELPWAEPGIRHGQ
jgi:succinate-acetate transporter protein